MDGTQIFEQQVQFYHAVFLYCAIAAVVFFVIAIVLFFQFRIPRVFGELSGREARKAIEQMSGGRTGSLYQNVTTPVYRAPVSETMVLDTPPMPAGANFVILRSIVEIHTDERIG